MMDGSVVVIQNLSSIYYMIQLLLHWKARDSYAKLTAEQKAQRNAKRREAYALKRNGSCAPEMHTLITNCGIVSTAKTFKHA